MNKATLRARALGAAVVASAVVGALAASANANPYLTNAGFSANALPAEDDSPSELGNIGFTINFFGTNYTQVYINNNGNVTFSGASPTYTPSSFTGRQFPIIAPFYADVDTRAANSGVVTYGTDTVNGHPAFGVDWPNVGYYDSHGDKLNTFQLVLIDRNDIAPGDFDMEFNYSQIQWETGDASGGTDGLGGTSAAVGYSAGTGTAGTYDQFIGSFVNGALLDGGPDALSTNTNDGVPGQYLFSVPEPTSATMLLAGSALLLRRRPRQR